MSRIVCPRGMYYPRGPLARGLVAAYPMDEGAGSVVHDMSGNGHHATLGTNFSWNVTDKGPGILGTGANYSTTTTACHIASLNNVFAGNDALTMVVWARTTSSSETRLIGAGSNSLLIRSNSSKAEFLFLGLGEDDDIRTTVNTADGEWHLCVAVYDGSTQLRFHIDEYVETTTCSGSYSALSDWLIGGSSGGPTWDGDIADVLIYDRALTPSEIRQLYLDPDAWRRPQDPWELWTGATSGGGAPAADTAFMTTNTGFWGY